jgi:hypothetical protein
MVDGKQTWGKLPMAIMTGVVSRGLEAGFAFRVNLGHKIP